MKNILLALLLWIGLAPAAVPFTLPLRPNGTVVSWLVALPLPNDQVTVPAKACPGFYIDFLSQAGGEAKAIPEEGDVIQVAPGQQVIWQPVFTDSTGTIDFLECLGGRNYETAVAYAFCIINVSVPQKVLLKIGSDDAIRLWVNQDLIHDHHVHRGLTPGQDVVACALVKGENRILAKIDQSTGDWAFHLSFPLPIAPSLSSTIRQAAISPAKIFQARLQPYALLVKTSTGERQKARLELVTSGLKKATCKISHPKWSQPLTIRLGSLPPGKCYREVLLPLSSSSDSIQAMIEYGAEKYTLPKVFIPVIKPWTVYLVQHAHTDIGYTRPQTEILPEHLRYIDYALDFCDLTDSYPEDSKFRWTCEISWAVREYLKYRPQHQIERLKRRIAEGRVEVTGMFLNMSDIADEATLAASLQPLAECKEILQAPIVTAMQNDVNGLAWCLADFYADAGIKYVSMGINKTRSLLPFDRPTAFWWESPSGKRVLAWRPDHYMTGNFFKIHTGQLDLIEPLLLQYLHSLEQTGYPFDRIAVQYSGYSTDNSPPAMVECQVVKAWNEKYASPKLRIATAHEFLDYVSDHHQEQLPVHRQAWPDWWTDGFGSAARETEAVRQMQIAMQINQGLLAMARLQNRPLPIGVADRIRLAYEALLFYDEHTFGAAESISDPMAENSMIQWGEKSSYAWEAVKRVTMLQEESMGLLQDLIPRSQTPTLAVFNTLNWPRSGLVETFIDQEMLPADKEFRIVDAVTGENIPCQKLADRSEGHYWAIWAKEVPALGFKSYRLVSLEQERTNAIPDINGDPTLENGFYRLQVSAKTGAVHSLFDKQTGAELVDDQSAWQLGQFIYEKLNGDRSSFRGTFDRSSLHSVSVTPLANGPIWQSLLIKAAAEGLQAEKGFSCEIRLYNTEKRVELIYRARKAAVTDPEAVYIAFPFRMKNSSIKYECQGGVVTPGTGQIPRSASDWQAIQNYAVVQGDEGQIVWCSSDIPLVQLGEINLGKWMETTEVKTASIYSWVMNNYWFTNFLAKQEGELCWRYWLTSQKEADAVAAVQFGWGSAVPLAVRVLAPGVSGSQPPAWAGLTAMPANVLMVNARPSFSANGIVLHLRETAGQNAMLPLGVLLGDKKISRATVVNVLEETLQVLEQPVSFKPYENKLVKLEW